MTGIAAADREAPAARSEREWGKYRTAGSLVILNRKQLIELVSTKGGAYGSVAADVTLVGKITIVVYQVVQGYGLVEEVATNEVSLEICEQVGGKHFV